MRKRKLLALEKWGPIKTMGSQCPGIASATFEPQPSTTARDPMEWITALGVAQKNAHDLLHETNSVSSTSINAIGLLTGPYTVSTSQPSSLQKRPPSLKSWRYTARDAVGFSMTCSRPKKCACRCTISKCNMSRVRQPACYYLRRMVRGLQESDRRVQRGP